MSNMKDVVNGIMDMAQMAKKRLVEEARQSSDYRDIIDALMEAAKEGNTSAILPAQVRNKRPIPTTAIGRPLSAGLDWNVETALLQDGVRVVRFNNDWSVEIFESESDKCALHQNVTEVFAIMDYSDDSYGRAYLRDTAYLSKADAEKAVLEGKLRATVMKLKIEGGSQDA